MDLEADVSIFGRTLAETTGVGSDVLYHGLIKGESTPWMTSSAVLTIAHRILRGAFIPRLRKEDVG